MATISRCDNSPISQEGLDNTTNDISNNHAVDGYSRPLLNINNNNGLSNPFRSESHER